MNKYSSVIKRATSWGWDLLWAVVLVSIGIAYITSTLGIDSRFWTESLNSTVIVILALFSLLLRSVSEWFIRGLLNRSPKKAAEAVDATGS